MSRQDATISSDVQLIRKAFFTIEKIASIISLPVNVVNCCSQRYLSTGLPVCKRCRQRKTNFVKLLSSRVVRIAEGETLNVENQTPKKKKLRETV